MSDFMSSRAFIVVAWALVAIPLLYGITETLIRVSNLFAG